MPDFAIPRIVRLLGRVAAFYILIFIIWVAIAQDYHMVLGRVAARFIPTVVDSHVERIWFDNGIHYKINFEDSGSGLDLSATQRVTATAHVDTIHFGYPIMTFWVLAFAFPGPRLFRRLVLAASGTMILVGLYAVWITITVYEYLSSYNVLFLQSNFITNMISPTTYGRWEIPLLIFLGQVLPIAVYAALFLGFGRSRKRQNESATRVKPKSGRKRQGPPRKIA